MAAGNRIIRWPSGGGAGWDVRQAGLRDQGKGREASRSAWGSPICLPLGS